MAEVIQFLKSGGLKVLTGQEAKAAQKLLQSHRKKVGRTIKRGCSEQPRKETPVNPV